MADFGSESGFNPNLKKAREEYEKIVNCPKGYIEYTMSTKGKIGAAETIRFRNFSPEDLMDLGSVDKEEVPIKLLETLDSLIYNPDNDPKLSVKNFHEKEVIEFLLYLYESFYTTIFPNQEWELTEEDWEFKKKELGGQDSNEFRAFERAIKTKQFKPVFDIDISKLDYYEIDDNFKSKVQINRKYGNDIFTATFSLPKFGDFITLKFFIENIFEKEDRKFARIAEIYKFKQEAKERLIAGENINLASIPDVPKTELDKFKEYERNKTMFAITASKALYIEEFDGQDVSDWSLEKKLELAKDPRLDYSTFKMVQDKFNELQFGLKEEITVFDPILQKVVKRKYSFRITDLLEAIRDTGTSETNVSFI